LQLAGGIGLAEWDRKILAMLPFGAERVFTETELEDVAAEGAALTLAEMVAYAQGEMEPFGPG
ncbi:MAG TPA: hypothetical protein VJZ50_06565, partial [Candidatus Limnocylindrales bacterium]|nr:hypothetical protein [Candidatus Limnocylindrales bacterium]